MILHIKFDNYQDIENTMNTTHFKVTLTTSVDLTSYKISWSTCLKNIYGTPGVNFDGYIRQVIPSESSIEIYCYTVEGPEEYERLFPIKEANTNWKVYRRSCVANSILCYASNNGLKIKGYTIEESIPV